MHPKPPTQLIQGRRHTHNKEGINLDTTSQAGHDNRAHGGSYPILFFRALGAFSSACSCPGRLATFPKSWPHWPTCVLAREHSVSRRLWPSRDATTRTPTRAWRGGVFCVLYAFARMWSCRPWCHLADLEWQFALLMFVPRHSWPRVLLSAVSPIPCSGVLLCV